MNLKSIPDPEYLLRKASPVKYKELVDRETCMPSLRLFSYAVFVRIAVQNLRKAAWILFNEDKIPSVHEYRNIDWVNVYETELNLFFHSETVYVLNTLIFCMVDYNPLDFFSKIHRHSQKYDVI